MPCKFAVFVALLSAFPAQWRKEIVPGVIFLFYEFPRTLLTASVETFAKQAYPAACCREEDAATQLAWPSPWNTTLDGLHFFVVLLVWMVGWRVSVESSYYQIFHCLSLTVWRKGRPSLVLRFSLWCFSDVTISLRKLRNVRILLKSRLKLHNSWFKYS